MSPVDLTPIAGRHGIRMLLQFGSTVTGQQTLFPGRKIDLAMLNHADPLFLKQVTDHGLLLHGSAAELVRLKLYAFKRYDEIDPRRVHEGLVAAVRDIPEYLRHVHGYLQNLSQTQGT